MAHIFISYSRHDSDYAHKLEAALKERGFEVWIDDRIDYGASWPQIIEENIDGCAAFVVIMTPRSKGSDWVQREVTRALQKKKPLFPFLLEGDIWFVVQTTQPVDVTDGRLPPARFYDRLARVVPPRAGAPEILVTSTPAVEEKPKVPTPSEPEMILIPAGEFLMGSDSAKDRLAQEREQPQHNLYLPDYYIAKTPVTNAQYLAFVQAVDHRQPPRWKNGNPPRGKEDHPVAYIAWYDANTYCRWLAMTTGKPYCLPSEAEWEKAARSRDDRIYPWGDAPPSESLCNFGASDRGTTPVGQYSPQGDSPYGCADMAGNVYEWTRSQWGKDRQKPDFKYPYDPEDGREGEPDGNDVLRVVRSGSLANVAEWVRCAARIWRFPGDRVRHIGFRVGVSPG